MTPAVINYRGCRYVLAQLGVCRLDFTPPVRFRTRSGQSGEYAHVEVHANSCAQAVAAFVHGRLLEQDHATRATWIRPNSGGELRHYQLPSEKDVLIKALQGNLGRPHSAARVWCACEPPPPPPAPPVLDGPRQLDLFRRR